MSIGDRRRNQLEEEEQRRQFLVRVSVVILVAFIVVIGSYRAYTYQEFPYSPESLLDKELGVNESIVTILLREPINHDPIEGYYLRATNPVTGDQVEHLSNVDGKVHIWVNNSEIIQTTIRKDGWHTENVNYVLNLNASHQTVIHDVVPYEKTRLFVQCANTTDAIEGVEVFFNNAETPMISNEEGIVFFDVAGLKTVQIRLVPDAVKYGEPYITEYTITDYYIWDKITIFFDPIVVE